MESFQLMMEAGEFLPDHVKPWTYWMQVVLFLLPLLFIKYLAPRILILTQVLNTLIAFIVFVGEGQQVTRLFGLGHFLWIWPAVLLFRDFRDKTLSRLYRIFAATAVVTITISLVLDTRDTARWILGERQSVLVNVPKDSLLNRSFIPH